MAHAKASIGTTNYAVSIVAGHHQLTADEGAELGGKDVGPGPHDLLCSALGACTAITLRMYAERKEWALRAVHVDVRFRREGKDGTIDRVLSFDGELDEGQRAAGRHRRAYAGDIDAEAGPGDHDDAGLMIPLACRPCERLTAG